MFLSAVLSAPQPSQIVFMARQLCDSEKRQYEFKLFRTVHVSSQMSRSASGSESSSNSGSVLSRVMSLLLKLKLLFTLPLTARLLLCSSAVLPKVALLTPPPPPATDDDVASLLDSWTSLAFNFGIGTSRASPGDSVK